MNRRSFLFKRDSRHTSNSQKRVSEFVPTAFEMRTEAGLEPWAPVGNDIWDNKKATHLLRRCLTGVKPSEVKQAIADGLDKTLQKLFTMYEPSVTEISEFANKEPQVRPASNDAATVQAWQTMVNKHKDMIRRWSAKTMATAPLSIQDKITNMWSNHFTSELQTVNFAAYMLTQHSLIRKYALGDFKKFVFDITVDPAMLIYLDGRKNYVIAKRSQINENYARELMELFTCGVYDWNGKANYSQDDVRQGARGLSGWDIAPSQQGQLYGGLVSQFNQARWDSGDKTFMGKTGKWNAQDIVNIIFSERSDIIAKYICIKIYREFVYDIPDKTIVEQMAKTLRDNNWQIKPVVEQLLRSKHFFADENIGAKHKSPIEYFIGFARALNLGNIPDFDLARIGRQTQLLLGILDAQGQTLFDPPNVKGWEGGRTWSSTSTLPQRQKWFLDIMDEKITTGAGSQKQVAFKFDPITFAKQFSDPNDIQKLTREIAEFLLSVPPTDEEYKVLYDAILDGGKSYEWNINDTAQRPDVRIKKLMKAAAQLAKFQLT